MFKFTKIDLKSVSGGDGQGAQAKQGKKAAGGAAGGKGKGAQPAAAKKAPVDPARSVDISFLELRVAQIKTVWEHPNSEKLWCETVDVGEAAGGERQIGSGLRAVYTKEQLVGRRVVVRLGVSVTRSQFSYAAW